jgi:hypothetical protein
MKTQALLFGVGLMGAAAEALAATAHWFGGARMLLLIEREKLLKSIFSEPVIDRPEERAN